MKKLFALTALACVAFTLRAEAKPLDFQSEAPAALALAESSTPATEQTTSTTTRKNAASSWNSIYFSYKPTSIIWNKDQEDMRETYPAKHSIALGFVGVPTIGSSNFTFRVPFEVQYTFGKHEHKEYTSSLSMVSLNLGVGFGYSFAIPQSRVQIHPFVGLHGRANLWGRNTIDFKSSSYDDYKYALFNDSEVMPSNSDDPIPMGKNAWKVFQIGLDVGIDFQLGPIYLGVSYVVDFNKLAKMEEYTGTFSPVSLKLGVAF